MIQPQSEPSEYFQRAARRAVASEMAKRIAAGLPKDAIVRVAKAQQALHEAQCDLAREVDAAINENEFRAGLMDRQPAHEH